jgi:hypothetical protein
LQRRWLGEVFQDLKSAPESGLTRFYQAPYATSINKFSKLGAEPLPAEDAGLAGAGPFSSRNIFDFRLPGGYFS